MGWNNSAPDERVAFCYSFYNLLIGQIIERFLRRRHAIYSELLSSGGIDDIFEQIQ